MSSHRLICLCLLLMGGTAAAADGLIASDRGKRTDHGSYLCSSLGLKQGAIHRALSIRAGDGTAVYDLDRLGFAMAWTGGFLDLGKTHLRNHKGKDPASPGGTPCGVTISGPRGCCDGKGAPLGDGAARFLGHHLHGERVVLAWQIGDRRVLESPWVVADDGKPVVVRSFRAEAGGAAGLDLGPASGEQAVQASATGATITTVGDRLVALLPAGACSGTILVGCGTAAPGSAPSGSTVDPGRLLAGGAPRWTRTVEAPITAGTDEGGYALDEFTCPDPNPSGTWMRLTGVAPRADGTLAVSTIGGDVWAVAWKDGASTATWRRIATGLYEPLGLLEVDGRLMARGRDRITRLIDVDGDGEIDFYENFHSEGVIGEGYHAFIFDLVRDADGNLYFSRSGRKSPHSGAVIRVSPDGSREEIVAEDFRHPNGMGLGGPHGWLTVSDNPSGKAVFSGAAIVRPGGVYGYEQNRTVPMLYCLPAEADNSSGAQCWAMDQRFGALQGAMIHTSYGRSSAFYVLTQDEGEHPDGAAFPFPFRFSSGVMRARPHPRDGQIYCCGLKGWDTNAQADGGLWRIRATGQPARLVNGFQARPGALRLRFACPVAAASVTAQAFLINEASDKSSKGASVAVGDARLVDGDTVDLVVPDLKPRTLPYQVSWRLQAADGNELRQTMYLTLNP